MFRSREEWTVRPVQRFHWDSAAYAEACATLVRCAGERVSERQLLREICAVSAVLRWGDPTQPRAPTVEHLPGHS